MDWITRRRLDSIWGPLGTILVHVLIVIVFTKLLVFDRARETVEVEVVIREIETFDELDDIEQELDKLDDIPTVVDAVAPPEVAMDQTPPPVDSVTPGAVNEVSLADLDMMAAISPLQFKGLYAGRSAAGRKDALSRYSGGMGERTEFAVRKSLDWLRDHQYPDGSWGPEYRVAMTGLALLAFLAHGDTTSSPEYGMAIRRGLQYLVGKQKGGWFIGGGRGIQERNRVYEHVIGTYAISEAYGLTQIPFLRFAMEDAVQVLIDGQNEIGSWDYAYRQGPDSHLDVSLAGWHIQALKAASVAGAGNRGLKTALEAAVHGMKRACDLDKTGMFRYGTREATAPDFAMTGVGVLCLQLTDHVLDAEARAGINMLKDVVFQWVQPPQTTQPAMRQWPIYAWYYITQARFHQGGRVWVEWNKQFAPQATSMQNPDGTWGPPPGSVEAGYGPVYSTSLMALMLQVYYRFLPTYQPIAVEERAKPVEESLREEDQVIIEFN